jgi:hypothetical protein
MPPAPFIYDNQPRHEQPAPRWGVIAEIAKILPPLRPTRHGALLFVSALDNVLQDSQLGWAELSALFLKAAVSGGISSSLVDELLSLPDYEAARAWLLSLYAVSESVDTLDLATETMRQRHGESVIELFARFRDALSQLNSAMQQPLPEAVAVRRFRAALLPHIRQSLLAFSFVSLHDIFSHSVRVEASIQQDHRPRQQSGAPTPHHRVQDRPVLPPRDQCRLHPQSPHTNAQCRAQASAPTTPALTPSAASPTTAAAAANTRAWPRQHRPEQRPPPQQPVATTVLTETRVAKDEIIPSHAPAHRILQLHAMFQGHTHVFPLLFDSCSSHTIVSNALVEPVASRIVHAHGLQHRLRGVTGAASEPEPLRYLPGVQLQVHNGPALSLTTAIRVSNEMHEPALILGMDSLGELETHFGLSFGLAAKTVTLSAAGTTYTLSALERPARFMDLTTFTTRSTTTPSNDHPVDSTVQGHIDKLREDFPDVFGDAPFAQPPEAWPIVFDLPLTSPPPFSARSYRHSSTDVAIIQSKLADLLSRGVIVPEPQPGMTHPFFLVDESRVDANGESIAKHRLVFNFAALLPFLPREEDDALSAAEAIAQLATHPVLSCVDLTSAYHLIPTSAETSKLLCFSFAGKTYSFKRVPFGVRFASSALRRSLAIIFASVDGIVPYADDLGLGAATMEEGLDQIRQVATIARRFHIRLSFHKCSVLQRRLDYLGFTVAYNSVQPARDKISAIASYPQPRTVRDLRQWLGLCAYLGKHIPALATTAACLYDLLKGPPAPRAVLPWNSEHNNAFLRIRAHLASPQVITAVIPDPSMALHLMTDASDEGIAAYLAQDRDGVLFTIGFWSRRYTSAERKLSIFMRELLAIAESLSHFRFDIGCMPVHAYCDNASLVHVLASPAERPLTRRVLTVMSKFASMNVIFHHLAGADNPVADALSRAFAPDGPPRAFEPPPLQELQHLPVLKVPGLEEHITVMATASSATIDIEPLLDEIRGAYNIDDRCRRILDDIAKEDHPLRQRYHVENGLLFLHAEPHLPRRLVIPHGADSSLPLKVLTMVHGNTSTGHGGFHATYARLASSFAFYGMRAFVRKFLSSCRLCQQTKAEHITRAYTRSPHLPHRPFSTLQIDTFSGIPVSDGNDCILSVTCALTRVTFFLPATKKATAKQIADLIFEEVCIRRSVGCPSRIQSDRAKTFTSTVFRNIMARFGTDVTFATTATPTSQALVERSHAALTHFLRQFTNESGNNWAHLLDLAAFAFNSAPHSVMGISPLQMLFGYQPQHPVQIGLEAISPLGNEDDPDDRLATLATLRRMASDSLIEASDSVALSEDATVHPSNIKVGSYVFVHRSLYLPVHLRQEEGHKLDLLYLGPVKVIGKPTPNAFELEMPSSFRGHNVVNVRFLKLCQDFPETTRDQPSRAREWLDGDYGYMVNKILKHRRLPDGSYEFLVDWRGYDARHRSYEPTTMFAIDGKVVNIQLRRYVAKHNINIDLDHVSA